jgi:uncharacterized sporulation protein YeaH/YhbH (DUF444 family)
MMNNPDPMPSSASDGIVAVKEPEDTEWSKIYAGFDTMKGIQQQQMQMQTRLSKDIKDVTNHLVAVKGTAVISDDSGDTVDATDGGIKSEGHDADNSGFPSAILSGTSDGALFEELKRRLDAGMERRQAVDIL